MNNSGNIAQHIRLRLQTGNRLITVESTLVSPVELHGVLARCPSLCLRGGDGEMVPHSGLHCMHSWFYGILGRGWAGNVDTFPVTICSLLPMYSTLLSHKGRDLMFQSHLKIPTSVSLYIGVSTCSGCKILHVRLHMCLWNVVSSHLWGCHMWSI